MPETPPLKEGEMEEDQKVEHPLRSGAASDEFYRRSGASINEEDLSPGERRRGGQDVRGRERRR